MKHIESKVRRYHKQFQADRQSSLPETTRERGSEQRELVLCLIPELTISRKVARELPTRTRARSIFGNKGCTGESGFDPVELWVMGPPCGLKVARGPTSCTVMIVRRVKG